MSNEDMFALIIPAAIHEPIRRVPFSPTTLVDALRAELGGEPDLAAVFGTEGLGQVGCWTTDPAPLGELNGRVMGLAAAFGGTLSGVHGTAAVTGGPGPDGVCLGLHPQLADMLGSVEERFNKVRLVSQLLEQSGELAENRGNTMSQAQNDQIIADVLTATATIDANPDAPADDVMPEGYHFILTIRSNGETRIGESGREESGLDVGYMAADIDPRAVISAMKHVARSLVKETGMPDPMDLMDMVAQRFARMQPEDAKHEDGTEPRIGQFL